LAYAKVKAYGIKLIAGGKMPMPWWKPGQIPKQTNISEPEKADRSNLVRK